MKNITRGSRLEPLLLPFVTGGVVGVKQTDPNDTSRLGPVSVISHSVHRCRHVLGRVEMAVDVGGVMLQMEVTVVVVKVVVCAIHHT
jgi:hypothetical protein